MYDIIKEADKYGLNRIFGNTREFIQVIEELKTKVDTLSILEKFLLPFLLKILLEIQVLLHYVMS